MTAAARGAQVLMAVFQALGLTIVTELIDVLLTKIAGVLAFGLGGREEAAKTIKAWRGQP